MMNDNLIDKLDEMRMLYFVIGSLFSADTLIDLESCKESLKCIKKLKSELPSSKYKDDPKIKQYFDDAEEIIRLDMEQFKKAEKNL